jgi:hypothetical protein
VRTRFALGRCAGIEARASLALLAEVTALRLAAAIAAWGGTGRYAGVGEGADGRAASGAAAGAGVGVDVAAFGALSATGSPSSLINSSVPSSLRRNMYALPCSSVFALTAAQFSRLRAPEVNEDNQILRTIPAKNRSHAQKNESLKNAKENA